MNRIISITATLFSQLINESNYPTLWMTGQKTTHQHDSNAEGLDQIINTLTGNTFHLIQTK